jgi:DNA-binding GntR family transcriptional regulator
MIPLNEKAYEHIKQLITTHQLSYDEIYSETKLAKELGISRTPFRDAIHRLAQEGYIDILPSRGFCLHKLTEEDVENTFQVCSALECYCTMEITKHAFNEKEKELFKELDLIMEKLKGIVDTNASIEEFIHYNFEFHLKIIHFIENKHISYIFDSCIYHIREMAKTSLYQEHMKEIYDKLVSILNTMKTGDSASIYEITLQNLK